MLQLWRRFPTTSSVYHYLRPLYIYLLLSSSFIFRGGIQGTVRWCDGASRLGLAVPGRKKKERQGQKRLLWDGKATGVVCHILSGDASPQTEGRARDIDAWQRA